MISSYRIRLGRVRRRGAFHDFTGRLEIYVDPRYWWIGADIVFDAVYVCPLPCLVLRWAR